MVLALLLQGLCLAYPADAHACCKETLPCHETQVLKAASNVQAGLGICCTIQPLRPEPGLQPEWAGLVGLPAPVNEFSYDDFNGVQDAKSQALYAKRHIADQSGRHLELGVLLT